MEKITNAIIVALAAIIASIIIIAATRKIKSGKYKKQGLFASVLVVVLSLGGYYYFPKENKKQTPGSSNLQKIDETQNTIIRSNRIDSLEKTSEWKNFKAFWQELDNVKPRVENSYNQYARTLNKNEADNLRLKQKTIIDAFKNIPDKKTLISDLEIDMLDKICANRIKYMDFGLMSMFTRMIPAQVNVDKDETMQDLEKKIDILIELRKNETINKNEFQEALSIVKDDIKTFSILETITNNYGDHYGRYYNNAENQSNTNTVEQNIKDFEQHYAKYLERKNAGNINDYQYLNYEDLDNKYKETKTALNQIKEILPSLNELIDDLEPERYE